MTEDTPTYQATATLTANLLLDVGHQPDDCGNILLADGRTVKLWITAELAEGDEDDTHRDLSFDEAARLGVYIELDARCTAATRAPTKDD